jgi:cytochrome c553
MSLVRFAVAAIAASAALTAHAQGNPDAGKGKVFQCQGCHGIPGWKTAFPEVYSVPKLGGQRASYIVSALKAYKSGERDFATMRAVVSDLSEQDMADIAAYYERGEGNTTHATTGEKKK